jgi:phosphoglycerate dehydrogenase-like enzyme
LIDAPLPAPQAERIAELCPGVELLHGLSPEALKRADVVYTNFGKFDPADAPRLRWVQVCSAAVNHILAGPLRGFAGPIANVRGAYTIAVAELTISLLLALGRRFGATHTLQMRSEWPPELPPLVADKCHGKTLGVVGYGSIGRRVARIADALGMTILACKRRPEIRQEKECVFPGLLGDPRGEIPRAWYGPAQLPEMFAACDAVAVALPAAPTTLGLIGEAALAALPAHAHFVNIGRGTVVDEAALIERLRGGKLAAAGLDVFAIEPLPANSPLWTLPNVFITPHVASYTRDQAMVATEVLVENLTRHLTGRPLTNVIDVEAGY